MMTKVDFAPPAGLIFDSFDGKHGMAVRFATCLPAETDTARGSILLCPGWTEFIEKYFPVIEVLRDKGFAVLAIDWPGQGASGRFLSDPLMGYIESFDVFTDTLAQASGIARDLPKPHVMLAHSMGGAIGLSALVNEKVSVDGAIFTTPMWGMTGRFFGAKALVNTLCKIGFKSVYATKAGRNDEVADSTVTYSEADWLRYKTLEKAFPNYLLDRPSWGWVRAAFNVLDSFKPANTVEKITCPVMVTRAEDEVLVDNEAISEITKRFPNAKDVFFEKAKHELLFGEEHTKAKFWQHFDDFLAKIES